MKEMKLLDTLEGGGEKRVLAFETSNMKKSTGTAFETSIKNKNTGDSCRDMNYLKKVYHPGTNMVPDEEAKLLADFHTMLNTSKTHFFQPLNVRGTKDVRHIEIHMRYCCLSPVLLNFTLLPKNWKDIPLSTDGIPAELMQNGNP